MKKSVFALAAMTAAAGAAQAQSSVSVYGIIDAGYKSVTSESAAVSSNVARSTKLKLVALLVKVVSRQVALAFVAQKILAAA